MLSVKVINKGKHALPKYETNLSAGLDLKANLDETIILKPLQRQLISTGLFIELPSGFEAQIRPRSGLAYKYGVTVLNSPGTIDADYRGEIKVLLVNFRYRSLVTKHRPTILVRVSVIIRRIEKIAYFPKLFQKIKINHFYFKVSIFIYLLQQKSFEQK